jgi:cytoskeletal protein RodZ
MAVFGDTLRQARAYKGVSLKEAEHTTRINRHHLLALEEERFHELPALIYQRGIVKNYGTYLDLDPNKLLAMFEDARGIDPNETPTIHNQAPVEMPNHWSPNFAIIAFLVVMSAVVFAWTYSVYFAPASATSTPTEVIPTVTPLKADSMFVPSPIVIVPTATATATPTKPATATKEPTKKATATATATKEADNAESPNIVSTSGNASGNDAGAGNADAGNASSDSGNESSADVTDTPAPGEISIDFTATDDIASLTVIVDGNNVFDGPLVNGDATGYITGANFEVHVSDPNALVLYKDGKSFQMGDSVFSLP